MKQINILLSLALLGSQAGCATVSVEKLASEADYTKGVRFYRPAPHVWILPVAPSDKVNIATTEEKSTDDKRSGGDAASKDAKWPSTTDTKVATVTTTVSIATAWTISIVMLPDYSQEYVVQWRSGTGNATANITLGDGWNLTAFSTTVDSQPDEMVTAITTPISTVASAVAGALTADSNWKGPGLYRLDYDTSTNNFKLGTQVLAAP